MRSLKEAELIAVCDVIKERALQCADQYGVLCYENYEELLKHEYIDVVCLYTPSGMHPNQTVMAAQTGKHVICEKPMAIHLEDVDRMVKVCEDHGVLFATIFPRRKSPSIP